MQLHASTRFTVESYVLAGYNFGLAEAIVVEAKRRNLPTLQASDFEALPGRGAQARVNGKNVIVGGPRLLSEDKVKVP